MHTRSVFTSIWNWIKSIFLNGLLILLPITFTVGFFAYTFSLFKQWLAPIVKCKAIWCYIPPILQRIPHAEFLLVMFVIFAIGFIFKLFFVRSLLHTVEKTFFKIPLMSQLYFGVKQMVRAFTAQDKVTFQQVIILEFPRKGIYSIGFLTGQSASHLHPEEDKNYFNVFIPTTPNPTSGYLIMVAENDFIVVDLTRQEAMSLIISGGIIRPERFEEKEDK